MCFSEVDWSGWSGGYWGGVSGRGSRGGGGGGLGRGASDEERMLGDGEGPLKKGVRGWMRGRGGGSRGGMAGGLSDLQLTWRIDNKHTHTQPGLHLMNCLCVHVCSMLSTE